MGFPTKNDHFGVFWWYYHLRKHPYLKTHLKPSLVRLEQRGKEEQKIDLKVKP